VAGHGGHTSTVLVFHFVSSSSSTNYGGSGFDARVTFALLAGAYLLETASLLKAAGSTWTVQILDSRGCDGLRRMVLWFRRLVKVVLDMFQIRIGLADFCRSEAEA